MVFDCGDWWGRGVGFWIFGFHESDIFNMLKTRHLAKNHL